MKQKTFNFYKDLFEFAASDYRNSPQICEKFFKKTIEFDFGIAFELWEYIVISQAKNVYAYRIFGPNIFKLFHAANAQKTRAGIVGSAELRELVFVKDPKAADGAAFDAALFFLVALRVDEADTVLNAIAKNVNYGPTFKKLLEKMFEALKAKNDGKVVLTRKMSDLLLSHARAVKTAERAVIEQRIKEVL